MFGHVKGAAGASWMAAGLAGALLAGASAQALAQSPQFDPTVSPLANRVFAGCVLDPTTVAALTADVGSHADIALEEVEIAFVVVYALKHDNDGQPLTNSTNFTGPVICHNDDVTGIERTTQTTQIPPSGTVDTLDAEDVFILRYVLNQGPNAGTFEKVICHTVNDNTDCFRISPLLP